MRIVEIFVQHHRDASKDSRVYSSSFPPGPERVKTLTEQGYVFYIVKVALPEVDTGINPATQVRTGTATLQEPTLIAEVEPVASLVSFTTFNVVYPSGFQATVAAANVEDAITHAKRLGVKKFGAEGPFKMYAPGSSDDLMSESYP
jgi:hypothetical protein